MTPDYILRLFRPSVGLALHRVFLLYIFCILLLLSFCKSRFIINFVLAVFFLITTAQMMHLGYFGAFIMPDDILKITTEYRDILETAVVERQKFYKVALIVLPPYAAIFFIFNYIFKSFKNIKGVSAVILSFFLLIPWRGYDIQKRAYFWPDEGRFILQNSLNALSGLAHLNFYKEGVADCIMKHFNRVSVRQMGNPKAKNIVLIIGESCRFDHFSLFGYYRKTTPLLDNLAAQDKRFIYKKGLSLAAATESFFGLFFNLVREPGVTHQFKTKDTNLWRMAKNQGYETFWISMQDSHLMRDTNSQDLDYIFTKENTIQNSVTEEKSIEEFKNIKLAERNFIMLHQKAVHSPYTKNYEHRPDHKIFNDHSTDRQASTINEYDNAIHYNDEILHTLISEIRKRFNDEVYIFFISDHGEHLGENGLYGHVILTQQVAQVPFFFYNVVNDSQLQQKIEHKEWVHQYDLGVILANLMGYEIDNPNYVSNRYYLHGNNFYGDNTFMDVVIDGNKVTIGPETKIVSTEFCGK